MNTRASKYRRIERLEEAFKPQAPSWEEMYAAQKRMSARIKAKLRTAIEVECGLTSDQIDEEAGPPYMWRRENLEEAERVLAGDMNTLEQEQRDREIIARYHRAHEASNSSKNSNNGSAAGIDDAQLEKMVRQIQRLIDQLMGREATEQDGYQESYNAIGRLFGREPQDIDKEQE